MTSSHIRFRPIRKEDEKFLYRVYASTRIDVEAAGLGEEEKLQFLHMQFAAQCHYYQSTFPNASYEIIMQSEKPVGRLYVDRPGDEIHVIDIALLPENRCQGIGGKLMADILEESRQSELPVRIYVEHYNTAINWYESLGFVKVEDIQTHFQMKWTAGPKRSFQDSA